MEKECAMGNGATEADRGGGGVGSGPTGGATEAAALGDHITFPRRDQYIASSSPFRILNTTGTEEMVTFTCEQWKELERQAMIYKYMISSLPVPPHLLYTSPMSMYNVGYTRNGVAVEPGRCKRTDGKKWRCSRDVAPHQKYCERHLHRGRPRSRKPVELNLVNIDANSVNADAKLMKKPRLQQTKHHFAASANHMDLGSMMEREREREMVVAGNEAERKWLESNMGFANNVCGSNSSPVLYRQDTNRVLTYSDFPASEIDAPVGFIDAWSDCNSIVDLGPTLPIGHESFSPSLSLSIGGSGFDGEMGNAQECDGGVGFYAEESRWPSAPVCWGAFGGPLAEALCANPPASPHGSIGGAATAASSPSGVIQRTLFSHSGGSSVCNSPSEIGFQRIN